MPRKPAPKRVAQPSGLANLLAAQGPGWPAGFREQVARMSGVVPSWETVAGVGVGAAVVEGRAWRPGAPGLIVEGDLVVPGNVIVGTGRHDHGVVIVGGEIRCRNLMVAAGFTLLCAGAVTAAEALIANAADSVTVVAGTVTAALLASGDGAWLTVFDRGQLAAAAVTRYVCVHGRAREVPKRAADVGALLAAEMVCNDDERPQIDLGAVRSRLDAGGSILRG